MKALFRRPTLRPAVSTGGRLVVAEDARELKAPPPMTTRDEPALLGHEQGTLDLPFRVASRLALLEREGRFLSEAILIVIPAFDKQRAAARELVVRALHVHLATAGGGELVLAANGADRDQREALLTLVEALLADNERSTVTVRLQFRDPFTRPSGLHSAVRASEAPVDERPSDSRKAASA